MIDAAEYQRLQGLTDTERRAQIRAEVAERIAAHKARYDYLIGVPLIPGRPASLTAPDRARRWVFTQGYGDETLEPTGVGCEMLADWLGDRMVFEGTFSDAFELMREARR